MIDRIRIQNYRSLIDVDVTLEPLTVLIGRSGTGKSNFVGAIRTLRDMLQSRRSDPLAESAPFSRHRLHQSFDVLLRANGKDQQYRYWLLYDSQHSNGFRSESLSVNDQTVFERIDGRWITTPNVVQPPSSTSLVLGALTGHREAAVVYRLLVPGVGCYDFPSDVLQHAKAKQVQSGYWDNGQNPLPIVEAILEDIDRWNDWTALTQTMSSLNPAVKSIDLALPERDKLQVSYQIGSSVSQMNVISESEGFRRFLATLLALYQAPSKQTLIFEHPENGIHPGALETLASEFKRHVKKGRGQIILTTHSPQLLDYFEPEQIRVVHIENQETKIGPLSPEQKEALREKLLHPGELLTVDPARLEGQLAEVPG